MDPAGRPHPDDYHKFLEQNRVIQRATERTVAEIKPLLANSQAGQASSQSQPNPAESSTQNGDATISTQDTESGSDPLEFRLAGIQSDGTPLFYATKAVTVQAEIPTTVSTEDIKKEIQAWWDQKIWLAEGVKNAATVEERQKAINLIVYEDAPYNAYNALMRLYEAVYGPIQASARFENDLKFILNYVGSGKPVYFSQYDKNWAKIKVSNTNPKKTIASSGCGLIAMTMVVATVTGRTDVTPAVLAENVKKYMTDTEGTGWKFYPDMAAKYGIHCDIIYVGDPKKIQIKPKPLPIKLLPL